MSPRLFLHDLNPQQEKTFLPQPTAELTLFSAVPELHHCMGCFGCWVKTPGRCVIADRGSDFVGLLAAHQELTIISRPVFGWLSGEVKTVLDRSIGFLVPFFTERQGGMHHSLRYEIAVNLKYVFYGDVTAEEQKTAKKIANANAVNLKAESLEVIFCEGIEKIIEVTK